MNRQITESRCKTFGRRNTQPCLNFSFMEKLHTFANNQSPSATFVLVFYAIFEILGTLFERDTLMLGCNQRIISGDRSHSLARIMTSSTCSQPWYDLLAMINLSTVVEKTFSQRDHGSRRGGQNGHFPVEIRLRRKYVQKTWSEQFNSDINWINSCNDSLFSGMKHTAQEPNSVLAGIVPWWAAYSSLMSAPLAADCKGRLRNLGRNFLLLA